jgi:hypothetical protein
MQPHRPHDIVIQRLDQRRYVLAVDCVVRYVGTKEECQRRLAIRPCRAGQSLGAVGADNALTHRPSNFDFNFRATAVGPIALHIGDVPFRFEPTVLIYRPCTLAFAVAIATGSFYCSHFG